MTDQGAKTSSEIILGIDLGTTNSAVAVVESGFPMLLANEEGRRVIPSAVWYGNDGDLAVGEVALRRRGADSQRVVTSVKRLMGKRFGEVIDFPLELSEGTDGQIEVLGRSPERVSAAILGELKRVAEWRLEQAVSKAVVTVPAYFNDGQRAATLRAGELAGLEVVRIINEPTAAALAYGMDKLENKARVAVYDFGGGTFDCSILEMQDGVFQVLATRGDTRLGGDDLDAALAEWCVEGFQQNPQRSRILEEAERVKRKLSESEVVTFRLPFQVDGGSIEKVVSRDDLARFSTPLIERTTGCCKLAMVDAGNPSLDAVILVGGSTRLPDVGEAVEAFFGLAPDTSQHPDEAIALGAAIQAGILSGAMTKMVLLDVTPLSLGIETYGGLMNVLISRNTTIPCKVGELFTNAVADQAAMKIRVLQGEREMARDNWQLGDLEVEFLPAAKGKARVGVQFRIDENGILEVLTRDLATGRDQVLEIASAAVDVKDERVESMVSESVEFAFDDMAERIFTEARLKAEELLPAIATILDHSAELISEPDRVAIQSLVGEVQSALESNDTNKLKATVEALDSATENVAALLVEQAMEEALARKLTE